MVLVVMLGLPLAGRGQWVQTNGPFGQWYAGFAPVEDTLGNLFAATGWGLWRSSVKAKRGR